MGQQNSKKKIYFRNEQGLQSDFLQSKSATNSKHIFLNLQGLNETQIQKVFSKLVEYQQMSYLTIEQIQSDFFTINQAKQIAKCMELKDFEMNIIVRSGNSFSYFQCLNEIHSLQNFKLTLSLYELNDAQVQNLYNQLGIQQSLTQLSINYLNTYSQLSELAQSLRFCKNLQSLELNNSSFPKSIKSLNYISGLKKLSLVIKLNESNSTDFGFQLAEIKNISFLNLNLQGEQIDSPALCGIIGQLKNCIYLTSLIRNLNMSQLGQSLCQIKNLQNLKIDNSFQILESNQGEEVLSTLQNCKMLKTLDISFFLGGEYSINQLFFQSLDQQKQIGLQGCQSMTCLKLKVQVQYKDLYKNYLSRQIVNLKKLNRLVSLKAEFFDIF